MLWTPVPDRLHPNGPRQCQKLFHAALKLLWFAIGIEGVRCENAPIRPLLRLEDGHVLATSSAIVFALCEGRTGLSCWLDYWSLTPALS